MPVGPFVFWSGGAGAAPPPPLSADRFSPKYLVGNFPAGDLAAATTFGGFIYFQDPGDGSGVAAALAQPNGIGDVYVRPGTYSGAGTFTVPTGVRVVGAGSSATLFTGFTFVMDSESTLASVGVDIDTDFCVRSVVGATGILLQDVILTSVGGAGCMQFTGGGFVSPYPRPNSIQRVDCSLDAGVGLHLLAGTVVSVDTLRISGGDESIRSETDSSLFGSQILTDTSQFCIHYLGHTGLGRTSVQDSQFFAEDTTIVGEDDTANVTYTRCILESVSGGTSMEFVSGGTLSNSVFDQCDILSNGLGIESLSGSGISFLDCRMTSQSNPNATLTVGPLSTDVRVSGGSITNSGPGIVSYVPVTVTNVEVESLSGGSAAAFFGPGSSVVANSVFRSIAVTGGITFDSPNNVFSDSRVHGVVRYTAIAIGCVTTGLLADASALVGPAVLVDGAANVFTGIRTRTAPAVSGVSLSATSTNNIVTVVSAMGPGVGGIAVLDAGIGNEVAHVIST